MEKRVFKYPIPSTAKTFTLLLPGGAKFLTMTWQRDQLMAWFEVQDSARVVERKFESFGTGQEIPDSYKYVSTFMHGPFVFHVYEI